MKTSKNQADGVSAVASNELLADVVDMNGAAIRAGQAVLVHQDEETRSAIVVEPLPDRPTINATGYWVDVNIGGRGPEGIPSYILEVLGSQPPCSQFFPLFDHMSREHGLTLTDSELYEIMRIVEPMVKPKRKSLATANRSMSRPAADQPQENDR